VKISAQLPPVYLTHPLSSHCADSVVTARIGDSLRPLSSIQHSIYNSVVQPSTAAGNVTLLAFAAERRAAAAPAVQQSMDVCCPPGPQQQTRRTPLQRDRQMDGHRTVTQTPPHTM